MEWEEEWESKWEAEWETVVGDCMIQRFPIFSLILSYNNKLFGYNSTKMKISLIIFLKVLIDS